MTKWTQEDIDRITNKADKKVNASQPASFALGRMKSGAMNKTEAAYANYLEKQRQFGDVAWYAFEPMNLKLADKCFYKVFFSNAEKRPD